NDIRLGIAAVTARIRTGRLKVCSTACPNLIAESRLYRYPNAQERAVLGEKPIDDNNHALSALRYLVSKLDHRFIAQLRKKLPKDEGSIEMPPTIALKEHETSTLHSHWDNPGLWTKL